MCRLDLKRNVPTMVLSSRFCFGSICHQARSQTGVFPVEHRNLIAIFLSCLLRRTRVNLMPSNTSKFFETFVDIYFLEIPNMRLLTS